MAEQVARRFSIGAELQRGGGAHVRVWAPACERVELVSVGDGERAPQRAVEMTREADGHFHAVDPLARAGGRYWFRLDPSTAPGAGGRLRPDPASRWQPDGPHEASAYVDSFAFRWTDAERNGLRPIG